MKAAPLLLDLASMVMPEQPVAIAAALTAWLRGGPAGAPARWIAAQASL